MRYKTLENTLFNVVNSAFLIILSAAMLYPMLNTLALSFNDGIDAIKGGIYLLPRSFSLENYRVVFHMDAIYGAFVISVLKSVVQVVTNLFFTAMLAYTISRKEYILAGPVTVIFVLTMYFNAGLIPNYLLIKGLHMIPSFAVYWVPNIISAFNLIVIRTQIKALPESLIESAKIDGAGEFRIFMQIVMPLCVPTLATIALFVAVGSWNSWFDTFLYNSGEQNLSVLQYELMKLLQSSTQQSNAAGAAAAAGQGHGTVPQTIRAAITIVTAVPVLIVYPFLQRYFVTGLTIGGVKE